MSIPIAYPLDWQGLEDFDYELDNKGLPLVQVGETLRYNPITIAQYGLNNLQRFAADQQPEPREKALMCADWLVQNVREWENRCLVWAYDYDLEFYGIKAPWISAMAQGEVISLLLRCHMIKPTAIYKQIAYRAVDVFDLPVQQGGVLDYISRSPVFEEYPAEPATHVLNGHIFALIGVYEYARYFDQPHNWQRMRSGLETVTRHWQKWDAGFWSLYDLHSTGRLASRMYHQLHVRQMQTLADMFHRPLFLNIASRWQAMLASPTCRLRWMVRKLQEKYRTSRNKS